MNSKYVIIILLVASITILGGCKNRVENVSFEDKTKAVDKSISESATLYSKTPVASVKDHDIRLYSLESEGDGKQAGYLLNVNGNEKEFDWRPSNDQAIHLVNKDDYLSEDGFHELHLVDLNGDAVDELVVLLHIMHGTGISEEEFHVIDMKSLSEIQVEDPSSIIKSNVKFSSTASKMIATAVDENLEIEKATLVDFGALSEQFSLVPVGCFIRDKKMCATYGIDANGKMGYVGTLTIEYGFNQGQYKMVAIKMEKEL